MPYELSHFRINVLIIPLLLKLKSMSDTILCPKCQSEFTYEQDNLQVCSQCFHEWDPAEVSAEGKIFDSLGKELQNGDSVIVIKDLPVKGAPKRIKIKSWGEK